MSALLLLAVFVLVVLNGFFVAAEFALVRARRSRLEQMAEQGITGSRMAVAQIDEISEYLSACQMGITLASLGIGFLGEPAVAQLIEPVLGDLGHTWSTAISIGIAYVLVTVLHITIGEQVPKVMAITRAEAVARRIAKPLRWFSLALRPAILGLNKLSNGMLRLIGIHADKDMEQQVNIEDLKQLIAESLQGGSIDKGEAGMLSGVFHLHEQEARQVMTPIPAVVTVDISDTVETALRRCTASGHTRLLVTEDENQDKIRGFVHSNSLIRKLMSQGPEAQIEDLVHDVMIVPETKPLDDLLADLQRERTGLAVVIDEYGRTAGIVTVEDIIEEVVGEIHDETDPAAGSVRRLSDGDWFVRGHVAITDLHDHGLDLPNDSDAYNSVGGFVFSQLGRLPKRGDTIAVNGFSIRVEAVRENRIEAVRIRERKGPAA